MPSALAGPTPLLLNLAHEWDIRRRGDPLSLLREIQHASPGRSSTSPRAPASTQPPTTCYKHASGGMPGLHAHH